MNSKTYLAVEQEREQVENHMCLCIQVDANAETMTTVSPSEPLLAEAASHTMQTFNLAVAMMEVLEGFSINQGDRGELLVMLLLTMARDAVVHMSLGIGCNPIVPTLQL